MDQSAGRGWSRAPAKRLAGFLELGCISHRCSGASRTRAGNPSLRGITSKRLRLVAQHSARSLLSRQTLRLPQARRRGRDTRPWSPFQSNGYEHQLQRFVLPRSFMIASQGQSIERRLRGTPGLKHRWSSMTVCTQSRDMTPVHRVEEHD